MRVKSINPIFAFLVVILLVQSSSSSSTYFLCNDASQKDPNFTSDFCVSVLEPALSNRTQITLRDALNVALNIAASNATRIGEIVGKILGESDASDRHRVGALRDCYSLYASASSTIRDTREDLKVKDYYKANIDISALMSVTVTCEGGFAEKEGETSPLTKENDCFFHLTAMALTFVTILDS